MAVTIWIVLGAIAGAIASIVMKKDRYQGPILNVVIGVIGAVIGGAVVTLFSQTVISGTNLYSLVVSTIGAITLIAIVKSLRLTSI